MSRGKNLKKHHNGNYENNPRRGTKDRGKKTASSAGCNSMLSCCTENKGAEINNDTSWDYPCDEYDYIVEKLVIKRVPIALFATSYDVYEDGEATERKKNTRCSPPICQSERTYPLVQPVNSALFYTSLNSTNPPGFPTSRPSNKTLRFSRAEDVFDDDDALASTSGYNDHLTSRFHRRDAELLNKFTALHPHLKESERAPKDPCPLNDTRSRRSLAEEISEIAATKEGHNLHYQRSTRNGILTTENNPHASRELTSKPAVEEIPTRDKAQENSSRARTGSSSCFPYFGWRSESRRDDEDTTIITQHAEHLTSSVRYSPETKENQNFIVAPVQVHYTSPNLDNIRKIMRQERNRLDAAASGNKHQKTNNNETLVIKEDTKKEAPEEFSTDGNSDATDEPSLENLEGNTLRWKIIIKHHPTDNPATTSATSKENSQPILSKGLRDAIEARNRRDSTSLKTNRAARNNKIKDQNS